MNMIDICRRVLMIDINLMSHLRIRRIIHRNNDQDPKNQMLHILIDIINILRVWCDVCVIVLIYLEFEWKEEEIEGDCSGRKRGGIFE